MKQISEKQAKALASLTSNGAENWVSSDISSLRTLKSPLIHSGLLSAIVKLEEARLELIDIASNDEEVSCWMVSREQNISEISDSIIKSENEIADLIGVLIPERLNEFLKIESNTKKHTNQ